MSNNNFAEGRGSNHSDQGLNAAGKPEVTGQGSDRKLIIGGGLAGLACGCYLQMNGFQSEIIEADLVPGGLCAAWDRGAYTFDGCLRWLVGTDPDSAFHRIWRELGAIAGRTVINHDSFMRIEGQNGKAVSVPASLDELAREFKRIAPEDTKRIDTLLRAARRCASLEPPMEKPLELMTPFEKIKLGLRYLPTVPVVLAWKNRTVDAYLATYQNEFLRQALMAIAGDGRTSAMVLVMLLAWRSRKNAGYVTGGSRAFIQAIADRYVRLGGHIRCNTRVVSVTVEHGRATGVRCADGTVIPAATVISCADGRTTIYQMLEGRFVDRKTSDAYAAGDVFPGHIQVSLGIQQTFPDAPHTLSLPLFQPLRVDDQTHHARLPISVFTADAGLCPEGCTVITIGLRCRCEFWTALRKDNFAAYQREKQSLLQQIVAALDIRFPGLAQQVEVSDVATPATFVRHTGNWLGSCQGWMPTPRVVGWLPPRTLPGLKEFYMAGHWVEPGGGLPYAALSARYAAQMICASHGRPFTTTEV
ncbi:MAG: NAD(P)/FAD-dependent oxidoreductase [Verrucomicrobiota bacterium]